MSALLLVHDHLDVIDRLRTLLEGHGFDVTVAATAFGARSVLERSNITAIIAGLEVGGGSGHSLLAWTLENRPELARRLLILAESSGERALAAKHEVASADPSSESAILSWVANATATREPAAPEGPMEEATPRKVLLLVESDPKHAVVLTTSLEDYGFLIEHVASIEDATRRLSDSRQAPDVILSGWRVGSETGALLYDLLAAENEALLSRCIFISEGTMREIRQRAPLATSLPRSGDSRVLIAAVTKAARLAVRSRPT